jgi:predicted DNA-binding protein (MmcQ/YjbR family)
MTSEEFKELALSFPGTIDAPHFERVAFKVLNKKIFATLHEKSGTANIKFAEMDQQVYCSYDHRFVYPVPNKWGLQGWTTFEIKNLPKELLQDALDTAYKECLKVKQKNRK